MKKLFILSFLVYGIAFSQENELRNDTLFLAKGGFLVEGQNIKLGKGSKDNGDFRHIEVSSTSMMRQVNTTNNGFSSSRVNTQEANALSNEYNNLEGKIIRFDKRGTKKTGFKYMPILGIGLPQRYQVDIDNAIQAGEVLVDGYKLEKKEYTQTSDFSIADELKKLKDLMDQGILTEEEFNLQKEKLLNK